MLAGGGLSTAVRTFGLGETLEFFRCHSTASQACLCALECGDIRTASRSDRCGKDGAKRLEQWRDRYRASPNPSSRPSRSKLGVEPLEFDAGVVGRELPIGFGVMLVSMGLPSGDLSFEGWLVGNAAIQALAGQDGEFGFGHVEPASVFGRVMPLETLGEAASFLGG